MTLFRRLPRLVWSPQNEDIIPSDVQLQHPALANDFKTLEDELLPHFRELNADALRYQNERRGTAAPEILSCLFLQVPIE